MAHPDVRENVPEWLRLLAADPAAGDLGLAWLSETEGRERVRAMAEAYAGEGSPLVPLPEAVRAFSREALQDKIVVATGPHVRQRVSPSSVPSLLILDTARPDQLFLALSADYPPFLWIPAGTSAQSIRDALRGYFPDKPPKRAVLHRIARFFFGNEAMLDTDIHGVENHYLASPFTAELSWGSACPEDPWPEHVASGGETPDFMAAVLARSRQAEGSLYTTSFRLQHSRGVLTLEDHAGLFVVEIRYLPSAHRELVAALNRRFGFLFPPDMPLDAVAALLGLTLHTETSLKDTLRDYEQAEDHDFVFHALAALKYGDLTLGNDLRPLVGPAAPAAPGRARPLTIPPPPSVREAAQALAEQLGLDYLLLTTAAGQTDAEILAHLDRALARSSGRGWEGAHGPDLLLAGEPMQRPSLDWLWGHDGWELVTETPRAPRWIFQRTWRTPGGATVGYGEDHRLGLRFFTVEGKDREVVVARLRETVPLDDGDAVLAAAETASDPRARAGAILRIARLAPVTADPRWMALLEGSLAHESTAVRAAALLASAWIAWPELASHLAQMPPQGLHAQAEQALRWIEARQR